MKRIIVRNYKFIYFVVILFLCVAIVRLSFVTLSNNVDGMNIEAFANSRNTVDETLYANRGQILDVTGENLAQTVNSYTLIAYLEESRTEDEDDIRHVIDKAQAASLLAPIINQEESEILEALNKDKYQVELEHDITELVKSQIEALNIEGLDFIESTTRYYKSGTFASYIVGYAKTAEDGQTIGELGIEQYFNEELTGTDGSSLYQVDAYGYKIPNVPETTMPAVSGSDIYLTIDSNIQLIAENAINKINKEHTNEWSIITVMDANTGAIVASATNPSFNPNDLNTITNFLNPLTSFQYEPGSTMKTFSFAASIEEGLYDGNETFTSGSIDVADVVISDFNKYGWGDISYDTGYAYSSNVGTTLLALELGSATLMDYYERLGFGDKTGIELAGETYGKVDFYYQSELANASFGQGLSVTPIQMLQAYTAITNDGSILKPYIVDKIVDENGEIEYQAQREEVAKVYSKTTTDYMQNLMYNAVYNGASTLWRPENVTVIGKTGTAQIANPSGGYLDGAADYIRSFAAIFPKENPKYILYMASDRYTGPVSQLSDITTTAIEEIASYAKITDTEINHVVNEKQILSNYISSKTSDTIKNLEAIGLKPIVIGDGLYITNQYPLKSATVFAGDKVFLKTNYINITMPDITGYSANEVKTIANIMGIKYEIEGYGYVTTQNLEVNSLIAANSILKVTLE